MFVRRSTSPCLFCGCGVVGRYDLVVGWDICWLDTECFCFHQFDDCGCNALPSPSVSFGRLLIRFFLSEPIACTSASPSITCTSVLATFVDINRKPCFLNRPLFETGVLGPQSLLPPAGAWTETGARSRTLSISSSCTVKDCGDLSEWTSCSTLKTNLQFPPPSRHTAGSLLRANRPWVDVKPSANRTCDVCVDCCKGVWFLFDRLFFGLVDLRRVRWTTTAKVNKAVLASQ